ncbi:hypothetical protein QTJ16_005010 [Diplocarpon rosae]|uniref:Uracil-DNA glycosylase-like domain-containing protein n=1 Tax=Diplocarpon rosae TaxID=946125 RepID=A0AAD9WCZ6_9HELO|nr:hypothetical protein QTJ16_005010 [Diplocarpon rosae]
MDNITNEEEQNESVELRHMSNPLPATFQGKLNLASFSFSPKPTSDSISPLQEPRIPQSSSILGSPASTPKRKSSTCLTPSPSPAKKARPPSGYAPPSTYAYLPELRDVLEPNLICVFIGLNPGIETARSGHAYAHPSNLFWKLLHSSGCTTRRCRPEEDGDLPRLFEMGHTNIVARPTRNGSELSKEEMDASVKVLEEKIQRFRPEAVCIVGKSIWESVWRVKKGKKIQKGEFRYGWQDASENMGMSLVDGQEGSRVFIACSTSGLAANLRPLEKEAIWKELGIWVEKRREERARSRLTQGS